MFRDWDDLRVFLGAARSKAFTDAASKLAMDPATVARRVQRLESEFKATLFTRSPRGLQLTAAGAALLEAGQAIEAVIDKVRFEQSDLVTGTVRISASEGFGGQFIAPAAAEFLRQTPGLSLELVANSGFLSASNREVDVAVTMSPPASSRLAVEKLTPYTLSLYAAPSYLAQRGRPTSLERLIDHDVVGYIDDLIYAPELRYLSELNEALKARAKSSSIRAQLEMTRAGAGLCVLPDFMARGRPGLELLLPDQVRLTRTFWLSVHRDLQQSHRVRTVCDWLRRATRENRALLLPDLGDAQAI